MNLREFIKFQLHFFLLEDTSEQLSKKLNPDEKRQADEALHIINNQIPGYEKFRWPDENYLSKNQWNYIIENLVELAKKSNDKKYSKIFSNIYYLSPIRYFKSDGTQKNSNSPFFNSIIKNNKSLQSYYLENSNKFTEASEQAWEKMFYTDYWFQVLNKYKSIDGSNFGAFVSKYLQGLTKDYLKSSINKDDRINQSLNKDNSNVNLFPKDKIYKDKNHLNGDHHSKIFQLRKAFEYIFNSAKTLPLTTVQQNALQALREMVLNLKSYEEIANEFPELLGEKAPYSIVISRLKNKALINCANEILSPYNLYYNIFSDINWQQKYNLPNDIIDQILNKFNSISKYSPPDKRKFANDFTLFAKYGLTPKEIFDKCYKESYSGSKNIINMIHSNLFTNDDFIILADRTLKKFGFTINFEDIPWSQYIKISKEFQNAEKNKQQIRQYAENFISEVKRNINK